MNKNRSSEASEESQDADERTATTDIVSILTEWLGSHSDLIQRMSKLVLADARLAAVSGLQLAVLAFAFAIFFVCLLIVAAIALAIFLMWLGISLGASITAVLLLHVAILAVLFLAIRSTYEGLTFKASRESVFSTANKPKSTMPHDQVTNNK